MRSSMRVQPSPGEAAPSTSSMRVAVARGRGGSALLRRISECEQELEGVLRQGSIRLISIDWLIKTKLTQLPRQQDLHSQHAGSLVAPRMAIRLLRSRKRRIFVLTYGWGTGPVEEAYRKANPLDPKSTTADLVQKLSKIPLAHPPGTVWEYSLSTDVLGRVVEVVSGERLDRYFQKHIFAPLKAEGREHREADRIDKERADDDQRGRHRHPRKREQPPHRAPFHLAQRHRQGWRDETRQPEPLQDRPPIDRWGFRPHRLGRW